MKKILLPILFFFFAQNIFAQFCFTNSALMPVGATPKSIASADFNNDGKPDIAVPNQNTNDISILLGNGTGGFSSATTFTPASNPQAIAIADFNSDGKKDLAYTNYSLNTVYLLFGDGTGGFNSPTSFSVGTNPMGITTDDFNNDTKPDLAVTNYVGNTVSILIGNGPGNFLPAVNYTVGNGPTAVITKDWDADGFKDLAVTCYNSNFVTLLMGDGTGLFTPSINYSSGVYPQGLTTADLNIDGKPDLIVANAGSNDITVRLNTGSGTFASPVYYPAGSYPYSVVCADFDSDGKQDVAACNSSSNDIYVFPGDGMGALLTAHIFTTGTAPFSLLALDMNSDTKLDLVNSNSTSGDVQVMLYAPLTASAGADQFICTNTTAIFLNGTSSTGSCIWTTTGSGFLSPNSTTLTPTYNTGAGEVGTVTISITTTNNGGCSAASDTMVLHISPLPAVMATAGSPSICVGSSTSLAAAGATNYTWTPGTGLSCTMCSGPVANPTMTTTYSVNGMDMNGCVNTGTVTLMVNSDTLSGLVTDTSNNPVTAGKVYIFQRNYLHAGLLDTMGFTTISLGSYAFPCLDTGNYIIKVVADTILYPTSIGTYYSNKPYAYQWDSATVVVLNNVSLNYGGKNVKIIQIPAQTGPGMISGKISEVLGFGQRQGAGNSVMGAPLKGVDVKLGKNPGGSPAARTTTDSQGNYTFGNLPINASYRIFVDVPNYPMDSVRMVTLTSGSPTSSTNNYFIDSVYIYVDTAGGTTHLNDLVAQNKFTVYPNPSTGKFFVESTSSEKIGVQIFDLNGKIILAQTISGKAAIDAGNLSEGVYTLSLKSEGGILTRKLVIVR